MESEINQQLIKVMAQAIKDIDILMQKSHWAQSQNASTLLYSLREELAEFAKSIELNDEQNSYKEAGDILMILMCIFYCSYSTDSSNNLEKVLKSIVQKLETRFSHLYKKDSLQLTLFPELDNSPKLNRELEDKIWEESKQTEIKQNYSYCTNPECKMFCKVGGNNVKLNKSNKLKCVSCGQLSPLKSSSLLPQIHIRNKDRIIEKLTEILLNENYKDITNLKSFIKNNSSINTCLKYILSDIQRETAFINLMQSRFGISPLPIKKFFIEFLKLQRFSVHDSLTKENTFYARSWNRQCAIKKVLKDDIKEILLEAMIIFHYKDDQLRDLTIEVSNMYGCPVGCLFCASNQISSPKAILCNDYIAQVNSLIEDEKINPKSVENFYISFAGIGEPSIQIEEIAKASNLLRRMYSNVQFNIATFGINVNCFDVLQSYNLPIRTIQIPYYHHKKEVFEKIVPNISNYDLRAIIKKALNFQKASPGCRLKINYIGLSKINDSLQDAEDFCIFMQEFRDDVVIKLSFLNPTESSENSKLTSSSPERLKEIKTLMDSKGFNSYIFGTDANPLIGCGQLIGKYIE